MGQFSSCGPLHVFACFPLGRGLGLSMCLLAALRLLDAALVLAQGTLYWGASFTTRMPWMLCDVAWGAQPHSCYVRSTGIRLCGPLLTALLGGDVERVHGQGEVSQTSAVPMELANGSMRQIHYDDYLEHLHGCVTANQFRRELTPGVPARAPAGQGAPKNIPLLETLGRMAKVTNHLPRKEQPKGSVRPRGLPPAGYRKCLAMRVVGEIGGFGFVCGKKPLKI
ncbi:hypothetical protein HPB48_020291 [Haemaphysalis longicornis]|uniref:Uncharacterized protein n=1 Tax=Haemaphysalis longicornis TaxID=44386 RepID=A0A9J6GY45_HAELO|nr:hypothetical protein HPB48_020291 [Haemaphysalis longicornis]